METTATAKRIKPSKRGTFPPEDAEKLLQKLQDMNLNTTSAGFRIQFDLKLDTPPSKSMIESALNGKSMNQSSIKTLKQWLRKK